MMNWFRNAKFRDKFLLAFGIPLSFVVILASLAIITINNVQRAFVSLAEGPNRRLMYTANALTELVTCRRCILAIGFSGDDIAFIDATFNSYQNSISIVIRNLDDYYSNYINDEFKTETGKYPRADFVTEVKDLINNQYNQIAHDIYAASLAQDNLRVAQLVAIMLPIGEEITDILQTSRATVQQHVDEITLQTRSSAQASVKLLIVLAIFLFLLSLATSIFMSSILRTTIVRMVASISEIAKGNLSYPIRSDCKDELGMLSNHIANMVDTISMLNKAVAIVDNVDELIFVTDLDYNIIYANKKVEQLHGIELSKSIGQKCYNILFNNDDKPCDFCPLPNLLPNKNSLPFCEWERYSIVDGEERCYACKTSIIQWVDGSLVQIFTSKDATLNKYHEKQQMLYAEELSQAVKIAKESSLAKSTFLANMSHEIRTPMNAVMGMCELILRKELPQDIYENALGIKSASQNLLSLINDVLDLSKIESGMMEIIESDYQLTSLINDIISIIRVRLMEKPIQLVVNIDSNIPASLIGDEIRVRQILINLLSNAVKYTDEGFISLDVTGELKDNLVTLAFAVSDSGKGIKKEDLGKLFDNFVQIDMEKNKNIEGTGLGLAIVRNLCLAMGGDITVQSEYKIGSVFTVTLPQKFSNYKPFASLVDPEGKTVMLYETRELYRNSLIRTFTNLGVHFKSVENIPELFENFDKYSYIFVSSFMYGSIRSALLKLSKPPVLVLLAEVAENLALKATRVLTLPTHSHSVANILNDIHEEHGTALTTAIRFISPESRILIVDDIISNLKVAEGLMSPYQMQITICKNGREAVSNVAANEYDLVFMDHMMPEIDGLEATRQIRAMDGERFSRLPIIALSANAISGVREMFIQNGMNDFLAKPIEIGKLNAILEKWIPKEKRHKVINVKEDIIKTATQAAAEAADKENSLIIKLRNVPQLNIDKALSVLDGSHEMYEQVIKISIRMLPESLSNLTDLINENISNYTIQIHGVKSVLNSIGAYSLGESAFKLEELSRHGDAEACMPLNNSFTIELNALYNTITAILDETDTAVKQDGSASDLLEKLLKLAEAASFYDSALALEILSDVPKLSYGQPTDKVLADMTHAFECFDFDKALELVTRLTDELDRSN